MRNAWRFATASDPRLLGGSAGGCSLSYDFPAEGVYEVAFEERDQQGTLLGLVKRAITVQDFLIVSIGPARTIVGAGP
jgi:hypothetical protein